MTDKRILMNCSPALMWRAHDAMIMHKRILLHEGAFWAVEWIHYGYRHVSVKLIRAARRRSIDDCTPAEWDAASRAVRAE